PRPKVLGRRSAGPGHIDKRPSGDLEAQQRHAQAAVRERVRGRDGQADGVAELAVGDEDAGAPAAEVRAQHEADLAVEHRQRARVAEAPAVRRVDEDQAGRRAWWRAGVAELAPLEVDDARQTGALGVAARGLDGPRAP